MARHELLVADDAVRSASRGDRPSENIRTPATRAGMSTVLQDGVEKDTRGEVHIRAILAACSR